MYMFNSLRLNVKITTLALLCVLPVMAAITLMFFAQEKHLLARGAADLAQVKMEYISSELEQELRQRGREVKLLASHPELYPLLTQPELGLLVEDLALAIDMPVASESVFVIDEEWQLLSGGENQMFRASLSSALKKHKGSLPQVVFFFRDHYYLSIA